MIIENLEVVKDLVVVTEVTQELKINYNKEQIDNFMIQVEKQVKSIALTEENESLVKKMNTNLKKLKKTLKDKVKMVKEKATEDIAEFITYIDKSIDKIDNLQKNTDDFVKKCIQKAKDEKKEKVKEMISLKLEESNLQEEYKNQVEILDKYLNKTTTTKKTEKDIDDKISFLQEQQRKDKELVKKEIENIETIKTLCIANNIDFKEVKYFAENNDLSKSIIHITNIATKRKEEESRIKREQEEKTKKELEEKRKLEIEKVEIENKRKLKELEDQQNIKLELEKVKLEEENKYKLRIEREKLEVEMRTARIEEPVKEKTEIKKVEKKENKKNKSETIVLKFNNLGMENAKKMVKYFKENGISFEKTEEVTQNQLEGLDFLNHLDYAGVDNWIGWEEAWKSYYEEFPERKDD